MQPLQRGRGLGVGRRDRRHLRPGGGGAGGIAELALGDRGLLAERVLPRGRVGRSARDLGADVGELAPPLARAVQPAERRERLAIAGRGREEPAPRLGGAIGILAAIGELGALAEDRDAQLGRRCLGERVVDPGAPLRLLRLGREAPELGAVRGVARRGAHRLGHGEEGERRLVQLLVVHPRRGAPGGGARGRLGGGARLGLVSPCAAPRVRVARERARGGGHGGGVRPVEVRLQRGERRRVVGPRRERGREPRRGRRGVAELVLDAGALERRAGGLGRIRGALRQLPERLRAARRVAGVAERGRKTREEPRPPLRGRHGERLAERGDRAGRIVQPIVEHRRALREQCRLLCASGARGAVGEQPGGVRPALRAERDAGERREDRRVARGELERAPELPGRLLERAEVLLRDGRRAEPERELVLRAPREPTGGLDEQREELALRADTRGERLRPAPRLGVARTGAQRGGGRGERSAHVAQPLRP